MLSWIWLIPVLPLAGFLVLSVFGGRFPRPLTATIGAGSVGLSLAAAAAIGLSFMSAPPPGGSFTLDLWTWVSAGGFSPSLSFTVDSLSVVMILVVTGVGFLIHLYSTRFMADEDGVNAPAAPKENAPAAPGYSRFFAWMNLFVGSMLILVLASNLLLLYLGWEGVGLCSFLLIGFWYKDPENARSARKAFIVTRIGDVSLAVGLFLIATSLGTLDVREIAARAPAAWAVGSPLAVASAALLLGGAVGKSAQLPLQTWLPDAMAGPSPVSALIHAATMVTAGVYLIARTNALFTLAPAVQTAVGIVGAAGVLVAGLSALTQRNIKRILAYSTMSQLGYMFLALGVGAWSGAIFHLVTHAFFKSLLFLGAGVLILALDHEHDVMAMGGMARRSPFTFAMFLIGALALAAIPPTTAGFSSKDLILLTAWQAGGTARALGILGLAGVFITSTYIFRLVFLVFGGAPRRTAEVHGHAEGKGRMQAGAVMGVPLAILGLLCLGGGFLGLPHDLGGRPYLLDFLHGTLPAEGVPEATIRTEWLLQIISEAASLLGIPVAWLAARRAVRRAADPAVAALAGSLSTRFLRSGWGFDWLYDRVFVRPFEWLTRVNARDIVDRLVAGATGGFLMVLSRAFRWTQNGRVRWYAAGAALGAVLIAAAVVIL